MKINEVSLGDYYKKAKTGQALAQMSKAFGHDRSPEKMAQLDREIANRGKGLERAQVRSDKARAEYEAKRRAEHEAEIRNKYANVDIDAEIAKLQPAIKRAYDDYQYGASNTYSQAHDEYKRLKAQLHNLEQAKAVLSKGIEEDWQKTNRRDKTAGMSRKAVKAYRRENPGSKLQTAVTTKPSKLKKGSKSAKRRKSFCARMSGMKRAHASAKTKRNPDSPINKALRRWNCESIEDMRNLIEYAEQIIREEKVRLDPKCWKGKKIGNPKTKMKGGVRVNNCVPAESVNEAGSAAQQAAIAISMKKAGKKPKNEN